MLLADKNALVFAATGAVGSSPRLFFGVADIAAGVARVRDLGGHADDPVAIPSGRFARCHDDQGTPFTLWQDASA
jgi:predicted enzyme related to lactoylglutathione lyase